MKLLTPIAVAVSLLAVSVSGGGMFYARNILHNSCLDLSPANTIKEAETSPPKVVIVVTPKSTEEGKPITVTVRQTDGGKFSNALIRTHCTSCSEPRIPLGTFSMLGTDLFNCGDIQASAAAADNQAPKSMFQVLWTPDPTKKETFYIEGTVFDDSTGTWWKDLKSDLINPISAPSEPSQQEVRGSGTNSQKSGSDVYGVPILLYIVVYKWNL